MTALVCGPDCSKVVGELSKAEGIGKILVAQDACFKGSLPEALSPLIIEAQKQFGFSHILSGASATGKVGLERENCLLSNFRCACLIFRMSSLEWQPS